jgi:excisionase family DNA binding protein
MSDLEQRLRTLVRVADPSGTVTIRWLANLVGERLEAEVETGEEPICDLTVKDVAAAMELSTSTVRGWLSAGLMHGYKLNGRRWRVTRIELREFQRRQAEGKNVESEEDIDIKAWRRVS